MRKTSLPDRLSDDPAWQKLATFPRAKFPGAPTKVRLGKTHAVEDLGDHSDPGSIGTTAFSVLWLYQRD